MKVVLLSVLLSVTVYTFSVNRVVLSKQIIRMDVVYNKLEGTKYQVVVWFRLRGTGEYYGRVYTFANERAYRKALREWNNNQESIKLELK